MIFVFDRIKITKFADSKISDNRFITTGFRKRYEMWYGVL